MSIPEACCKLAPVASDYQPQGSDFTLGDDLVIYETKDKSPKAVLICAYDIFGFHPNTKQFADRLNSTGQFRVLMPDFFRGKPLTEEDFGKMDRPQLMKFVTERGSWDNIVKKDILNVIEYCKKNGATSFGIYGFCWGGKVGIKAVGELEDVKGAALIHPSLLDTNDAEAVKAPVLFIPTKDDADMIPLYEIVQKNLGPENTEHYRFDDVHHGYAAARGDWTNEVQRKRVDETIAHVYRFFKKHLK